MAQKWKKEAARRGYWYRKMKKTVQILRFEIVLIKQEQYLHLINWKTDSLTLISLQNTRNEYQTKYLDFVKKYNSSKQENNTIKQEFKFIKQVNKANKVTKQKYKALKEKISDKKQEIEELEYMLEPMMSCIYWLADEMLLSSSIQDHKI